MPKGAKKKLTDSLTKDEEIAIEDFCNGDDKDETVARNYWSKNIKVNH